ncbi:MAG: hypothetical protein HRJ53_00475, partial [Acidobacteria bacterium Pan2503]|nr:hypothetical protein [Candidatus Acidoferrum panamensis]
MVQNLLTIHELVPHGTRQRGLHWYEQAHEAGAKAIRRHSSLTPIHAAGLISAISPGMEYDTAHIPAFKHLLSLKPHEWNVIAASHKYKIPDPDEEGKMKSVRSPEAHALLRGTPLAKASDQQLVNAMRIRRGEHPEDVLARSQAPKTYSFWHNIAYPDISHHYKGADIPGPVTIDGRAHDQAVNRMVPWEFSGRRISGKGGPIQQRYSLMEHVHRQAAAAASEQYDRPLHPHQFQAINWEGGKLLETGQIGHVVD